MSNNIVHTQSGERLTFYQLFNEKRYHIEIPIIQRDYAQGRDSAFEVRNMFLDALYDYLEENTKYRDLDFVYGSLLDENSKTDTRFIPLDGQQRLTTLFLLHWYLANKDEKIENFRQVLSKGKKSKFTYETRTSSREFCDSILNNDIDLSNLLKSDIDDNGKDKKNALSKSIRDSCWYFLSWDNDPTIKSMLVMLDAIHEKFQNSKEYFERLTSIDNPVITFQFLNLKEFKLTDDLYIKMNSRGKPLTPFENFKAKFEQLINKTVFTGAPNYRLTFNDKEKIVPVQEYFSHKIDTDWTNLFWSYSKDDQNPIFDDRLMNFVRATTINHYSNTSNDSNINNNVKFLIDKKNELISFKQYTDWKCFDENYIIDLIEILDLLKNGDGEAKKYLKDLFYYDEGFIFNKVIENNFDNFSQRIQFYAYCQYLIYWQSDVGLDNWMRIIHNLSENTIYNREEEYIRSIKSITKLLPNSNDILKYLSTDRPIEGFNGQQIQEERIKALLIGKGENWKSAIYEIEQHDYFRGQIGFILKFSGIQDYYQSNSNKCSWLIDEDVVYYNLFKSYTQKAKAVFAINGIKEFKNFAWERALLTKGNYLLQENRNQSLLINGKDRDISWKRLLRGSEKNEEYFETRRNLVKQIFDDPEFNLKNIENSLNDIIVKSNNAINDWRKNFIELSSNLEYLGPKKYIRFYSEHLIYLLSRERMSGSHCEYYSYSFFHKHLKLCDFKPFDRAVYFFVSGDEEEPCAVIDEWNYKASNYAIDVRYLSDEKKYELRFFPRLRGMLYDEIFEILESMEFIRSEKYDDNSFVLLDEDSEIIKGVIVTLCSSFQKLKMTQALTTFVE